MTMVRIHQAIHRWRKSHPECEVCDAPTLTVGVVDFIDEDGNEATRLAAFCAKHSTNVRSEQPTPATCPRCKRPGQVFLREGGALVCKDCRDEAGHR